MRKGIVWLRNDLRLGDHAAFSAAATECEVVVPVYVFDDLLFAPTSLGFAKTGAFRAQFLREALADLRQGLQLLGSQLAVHQGSTPQVLQEIAAAMSATDCYYHFEYTHEEQQQEAAVQAALPDVRFHGFHGSTLYHPDDLPMPLERLPDVFTQFRKKVEKYAEVREELPLIEQMPAWPEAVAPGAIPTLQDLGLQALPADDRAVMQFKGGEQAANARLDDYIWQRELIKTYKETRNGLIGEAYSTKFSPWLACGSISPRSIYHEVKDFEKQVTSNQSTYWVIFELIWRDYFKYVAMRYGKRIFYPSGIKGQRPTYRNRMEDFERWQQGQTGQPFVDANMNELRLTGFMSNRGRQNVASYLCKDLRVDWRWGAAWFEHCLLDYDPASNWGNWMYVAGVGNDPREDRYFNLAKQAQNYDPQGQYQRLWDEG